MIASAAILSFVLHRETIGSHDFSGDDDSSDASPEFYQLVHGTCSSDHTTVSKCHFQDHASLQFRFSES